MSNLSISIWVTHDCNLKCDYCYENEKSNEYMTIQTAEQVICFVQNEIQVRQPDMCSIHFHGGEPLLNAEMIWYIVANISYDKIKYSLTTNGTIINERTINKLVRNIHDISLSVDGNEVTHNRYRKFSDGNGSFQFVNKNLLTLLNINDGINVRMTIKPDTIGELFNNIQYLIKLGVKKIIPAMDLYDTKWTEKHFDEYLNELKKVRDYLYMNQELDVKINMINELNQITKKKDCDGGIESFSIDAMGRIFPCTAVVGIDKYQCGNVSSGIYKTWRKELSKIVELENIECIDCTYKLFCTATRCKLVNYALTGYYNHAPKTICFNENIKYQMFLYNRLLEEKIKVNYE